MGFKACTHEECLYYKYDENDNLTLIVRQVDDFMVCNKSKEECDQIGKLIQD